METLFKEWNDGSDPAKRAYDSIISTLLKYIQENEIVVPIQAATGNMMYFGIVTGKVDDEDKYTVNFIGFGDDAYPGVQIWGYIYRYFKKNKMIQDSSESIDDFFKRVHKMYELNANFNRGEFALKTPWTPITTDIPVTESAAMPEQSKQQDLAYHIFSVLDGEHRIFGVEGGLQRIRVVAFDPSNTAACVLLTCPLWP